MTFPDFPSRCQWGGGCPLQTEWVLLHACPLHDSEIAERYLCDTHYEKWTRFGSTLLYCHCGTLREYLSQRISEKVSK